MSERKLGVVKEIIEAAGMGIVHVYEDLVFAFLIQFTEDSTRLLLRINREEEQGAVMDGEESVRLEFFS